MWSKYQLALILGRVSGTTGVWIVLMTAIWWPFLRWSNEQIRQAHAAGIMVNAPELLIMLPIALAVVAGWLALKLERSGPWWWLLRVALELVGMTVLIGLGLAGLLMLIRSGRPRGAEPEFILILLLVAFLLAVRPVRWLERQRS